MDVNTGTNDPFRAYEITPPTDSGLAKAWELKEGESILIKQQRLITTDEGKDELWVICCTESNGLCRYSYEDAAHLISYLLSTGNQFDSIMAARIQAGYDGDFDLKRPNVCNKIEAN